MHAQPIAAPRSFDAFTLAPLAPTSTAPAALRRRRVAQLTATAAGEGVATLNQQVLPLTVRGRVRVSNSLLYPIAGAAIGALLLGIPGAILGGIAGFLLRR